MCHGFNPHLRQLLVIVLFNLISKFKNSQKAFHRSFVFKDIGYCKTILDILWDYGFIKGYKVIGNKNIFVSLLYHEGVPTVKNLCILSKATRRIYASKLDVMHLSSLTGLVVLSTTRGIMTCKEACLLGLGGEILLYVE